MVPDLDFTLPMNGGGESTIPSTIIDEFASTGTNLSFAPLRPNQILCLFTTIVLFGYPSLVGFGMYFAAWKGSFD
ncbi:hypothetical protein ACSQ67_026206 [Phaseolus vulgaris]